MPLIEARELTKVYRVPERRRGPVGVARHIVRPRYVEHIALNRLTLDIADGESIAYLGRNGAGKSTTIKMMAGVLRPTSGAIRVAGLEPHRDRVRHVASIGVVFGQRSQLWLDLPVIDSLDALGHIYGLTPAAYRESLHLMSDLLELGPILQVPARKLSLGQRMRADLGAALLHRPRVLFLDEPTIGLDVEVKARIRGFVRELVREHGVTVMLTTHDLADIETIVDRVTVIDRGELIFDGTKERLTALAGDGRRLVVALGEPPAQAHMATLAASLPRGALTVPIEREGAVCSLQVTVPQDAGVASTIALLLDVLDVVDVRIDEPSLERVIHRIYAGELDVQHTRG